MYIRMYTYTHVLGKIQQVKLRLDLKNLSLRALVCIIALHRGSGTVCLSGYNLNFSLSTLSARAKVRGHAVNLRRGERARAHATAQLYCLYL